MNIVEKINELVTEDEYTGYAIHRILNEILKSSGSEKAVRPQMIYNYLRNGMVVKGQKIYGETLRTVTKDEVITFLVRYVERNKITILEGEPTNPDQLELDLESVTAN